MKRITMSQQVFDKIAKRITTQQGYDEMMRIANQYRLSTYALCG